MQMRALGQGSLSSVLKVVVDVAWVTACAALGFIWLITLISAIAMMAGGDLQAGVLGQISIRDADKLAGWTIIGTVVCLGVMAISSLLRGIFETLVAGDPFVPDNAVRLRRIALILAILEACRMALGPIINLVSHTLSGSSERDLSIAIEINLVSWFAVLILVVLAQVFDEGARLREDQKMTI